MKKVTILVLALVGVLMSADVASALPRNGKGPLGRLFGREVSVTRSRSFSSGPKAANACPNGTCAPAAKAPDAAKPMPAAPKKN